MADTMNPVLELALKRFKLAEEAENDWRNKGLEADKFYVGDQWPTNVQETRRLESRPCLTLNQLPKFVRQVTNDQRMNRPSVKVVPVADADVDTANILEGLVRHIQDDSNADVAYDTACSSQVVKGFGYFRVITDYSDPESFDQDIKIKRIKNAFTVYFDPNCEEPDYSDAKWCFVIHDINREDFERQYPDAEASNLEFSSTGDPQADWANKSLVRVAEYFYIEDEEKKLCLLEDGSTAFQDEIDAFVAQGGTAPVITQTRVSLVPKVKWCKITVCDVLEEKPWPGKWIPIIPVLGDDLDVNGKRNLTGMVYGAMDPQRQYNYMSTAQTEAIALSPKAPFILAEGQIEGYERFWDNANTQNFSHLPYKPTSIEGNMVPPPQRQHVEPPIQAMVMATSKASDDLKGITGIFDAGLGARSNETSGKAIIARQKEGDIANFHYIDNLSRAIKHLGRILIDLIPIIYDAPRVVRIVGEDGTSEMVHVNTHLDDKGNPAQPGGPVAKIYDLSTGKYDVTVAVGPSFSTKRQESVDVMTQMVQAYPALMQIAGDILVKNMDWPQAQEVAERFKKTLPPALQDNEEGDVPPQAKAQMDQMGQMVEQLTATVHQLQDEKDAKSAELASKEKIAAMGNETQIVVEAMKQEMAASQALLLQELQHIAETINHSRQVELQQQQVDVTPPPATVQQ